MPTLARYSAAILLILFGAPSLAATPVVELRAYPVGQIVSAGLAWPLNPQTEWGAAVLYNRTQRGDVGRHEDESGDGFGLGVELSRFWTAAHHGWLYGARAELLKLDLDWKDPGREGKSSITVIQPTLRFGYRTLPFYRGLSATVSANLGAEINVATRGEKVGEGPIGLLSFALRYE